MSFNTGDFVRKKRNPGQAGTLLSGPIDDCGESYWIVRLADGTHPRWLEDSFEHVPTVESPEELLLKGSFGRKLDFSQLVTFHRLDQPLTNNIYALHTTRTDFYPHQFKPLLKFLDSPNQRMLIADEVGLGKTIEAGLILSELRARTRLARVLVVCPAALRKKWQWEMEHRFGEEFDIYSADDFLQFLEKYHANQGQVALRGITSIQGIRRREILEAFEQVDPLFDLVVVDEAHHMRNKQTLTHELGQILSRSAEALLLLTATPIQTSDENLFNLLGVLDSERFNDLFLFREQISANEPVIEASCALMQSPPNLQGCRDALSRISNMGPSRQRWFKENPAWDTLQRLLADCELPDQEAIVDLRRCTAELSLLGGAVTRTRKREVVENAAIRKPMTERVTFTDEENAFYERITECIRKQYPHCQGPFEKFVLMMPQRRAASCIPATIEHYLGEATSEEGLEDYLGSLGDEEPENGLKAGDPSIEIHRIVKEFRGGLRKDSKYEVLLQALKRLPVNTKILLFSTFPSTLDYLSNRFQADGIENVVIHGQVAAQDRAERVETFRDNPEFRVLLSSEVGSEGLDFQFCSVIVNYDLPWNPMVVEQRIGRLDRLGQRSETITIINFSVAGTIDGDILERLYDRIGIFERTIGLTDGILGNIVETISDCMLSQGLTDAERRVKLENEVFAKIARLKAAQELEEKRGAILVADQFLEDAVRRADELHRYVSGEEVLAVVMGFIRKHTPRSRFEPVPKLASTFKLDADESLRQRLRSFPYVLGDQMPLRLLAGESVVITFDINVAKRHAALEYVHVHHPLVRLIIDHYRQSPREFSPTAAFQVRSDTVKAGDYVFTINKLTTAGIRQTIRMLPVFAPFAGGSEVSSDAAEKLFADMIAHGKDLPHGRHFTDLQLLAAAYRKACKTFQDKSSRIIRTERDRDRAFRARRKASETAYFEKRINRQHQLASEHQLRASKTQLVKAFETRAANLEQELKARLDAIQNGSPFDPSSEELICGVIRVLAGKVRSIADGAESELK